MAKRFLNYFSDKERSGIGRLADLRTRIVHPMTRFLIRLGLTPNLISFGALSLLIPLAFIFEIYPIVGAALLLVYISLDGIDGAYARLTGSARQSGALVDIFCDQLGLVVVGLGAVTYGLIDPRLCLYYVTSYMVMIAMSVVQNAMRVPMQVLVRTKYYFYTLYLFWGIFDFSIMNWVVPLFALFNTIAIVQSFLRIGRHLDKEEELGNEKPAPDLEPQKTEEAEPPPYSLPSERWRGYLVVALVVLSGIAIGAAARYGMWTYHIDTAPQTGGPAWTNLGTTPEGEKKYPPQGMTTDGTHLIFSNHWNDAQSRVYKMDPDSLKIIDTFDMPEKAVHTSGLAWHDKYLWAIDYSSLMAYKIDAAESFATGQAVVQGSFHTGLGGASACCIVTMEGKPYLAVSDFLNSRKTVFVDMNRAIENGSADDAIVGAYRNGGFSQGVVADDQYLYESENRRGTDVIRKYDLLKLFATGDADAALVAVLPAPAGGVEDMAILNGKLWTSDETTFAFYNAPLD